MKNPQQTLKKSLALMQTGCSSQFDHSADHAVISPTVCLLASKTISCSRQQTIATQNACQQTCIRQHVNLSMTQMRWFQAL